MLFVALALNVGGEQAAREWVKSTAVAVRLNYAGDVKKSGISRLVQRQIMLTLHPELQEVPTVEVLRERALSS